MIFAKAPTAAGDRRRAACVERSHIAIIYYTTLLGISQYQITKIIAQAAINSQKSLYISNKHAKTATATPHSIPAKKRSGPRGSFLRLGRSIPLSSKIRFASFSISSRVPRLGLTSRRSTKYASSKYRLSPVLTTIICFCAPFIMSAPPFRLFGKSICPNVSKKNTHGTKSRKKRCKKASRRSRRGTPTAFVGSPQKNNTR